MQFQSLSNDQTVPRYRYFNFYKPHKVDGKGFSSQIPTLKTVPSDQKSNRRTCAEECQMPFNPQSSFVNVGFELASDRQDSTEHSPPLSQRMGNLCINKKKTHQLENRGRDKDKTQTSTTQTAQDKLTRVRNPSWSVSYHC